jgi:two-component system sensor histidine kinase KdpD
LVLLTLVLGSHRASVSLTIVFLLYLAIVVAVAAVGGPVVGVSTSVVAFLVVNFFYTEPLHTLNVADPERVVELLVFLAVSGTVASLMDTAIRRRDVIEEQTAEALALTAANELRTALLRAVSHDLRTPLTTAKMATSSLRAADVELSPQEREELVALADGEVDRLIMLVENLLDAGRLQAGALSVRVESIDLGESVARVVAGLRGDDRRRVDVSVEPDVPAVSTDAALLERVLANLVSNALHATTGDGLVSILVTQQAGLVAVSVVDHGPGLSDEQLDAAMRPFHRFEDRGASSGIGLGLPICAGFCEAIGARLDFGPTPGGGLTASVVLPADRDRADAEAAA